MSADEIEFAPDLPTLASLLDEVRVFVRRFVVLDDHQRVAVALWAAHTFVFDVFECTPYLAVTSALMRSGKSTLLELLELIAREPIMTENISDAALFRLIEAKKPSLLMDEVDAVWKSREREELRGLLNAGYRLGAVAHRMGGANNRKLEAFKVYCPKAFAGIGDPPTTIADRTIPLRLKRRTRDEKIERWRRRKVGPEGHALRDRLAEWLEPHRERLAEAWPELPDELDDRAQDVWEPLLAIADLAGGDWPAQAREAAIALSTGEEREDDSAAVQLLRDVRSYFSSNGSRVRTADLLDHLHRIEDSPWSEWYGKPLTANGLSKLLKPYRIRTMPVKVDGQTVRGYKAEQFADVFARVLGVTGVTGVTSLSASGNGSNASNASNAYYSKSATDAEDVSQGSLGEAFEATLRLQRETGEYGHPVPDVPAEMDRESDDEIEPNLEPERRDLDDDIPF